MFIFLLQSAILLAIAFILGCIIGCWLRRMFADDAVAPVVAVTSAAVAASRSAPVAVVAVTPAPEPQRASVDLATPVLAKEKVIVRKTAKKGKSTEAKVAAIVAGGKLDTPKPRESKALDATTPKTSGTKAATLAAVPVKKPIAVKLSKPIGGKPDNLTLINGIGNVLEKRLFDLGVFHFEQIANWTKAEAVHFGIAVGFPGRAERENWVKEAAIFAKGGTKEHARKVEAGDISTSRKSIAVEKGKKK